MGGVKGFQRKTWEAACLRCRFGRVGNRSWLAWTECTERNGTRCERWSGVLRHGVQADPSARREGWWKRGRGEKLGRVFYHCFSIADGVSAVRVLFVTVLHNLLFLLFLIDLILIVAILNLDEKKIKQSKPAPPLGRLIKEAEQTAPTPQDLLEAAEAEMSRRFLRQYISVISKLREKGFSFREIAEWLCERGVPADRNSVYRAFMAGMSSDDQRREGEDNPLTET